MPFRRSITLLIIPLIFAACGGEDTSSPPLVQLTVVGTASDAATPPAGPGTPPPQPGAALTPRPDAPRDLAEARRLENEGDLEAAADAYIATAAASPAARSDATLSAARVMLELERPAEVRALLKPFVANVSGRDVAAHYMLARAYTALRLYTEASQQYDLYIQSGRPAAPYAHLDRGRVLLELDQPAEAAELIEAGLNIGVPGSERRAFRLAIAQAYERDGNFPEAIRWYGLFSDGSELAGDDALALQRIAAIKRAQGDATYTEDIRRLLAGYPATSQAMSELRDSLARNEAVDPYVRGLIYYRHNEYTTAEPAFREQVNAAPDDRQSAEAYYYLGAILESRGDFDDAMDQYARTVQLNPDSPLADDALWWRARLLEDDGRLDEARPLYARIAEEYPTSAFAPDAAFRRGMLAYGDEEYEDAVTIWAEAANDTGDPAEKERLTIWQAKALIKNGNRNAAEPLLTRLTQDNQDDYYGIRARSLLENRHGLPKATRESQVDFSPDFDWTAAEAWLASRTGRPVSDAGWSTDPRWARAQELWLVGRTTQGDSEAFDLMESYATNPVAMYTMSRTLMEQGRIGMSGRAGQRLLRILNANPNDGLPKALLSLAYPPAFGNSAQEYARAEGISPLLMLAFVRQESFFDPRAVSPVGALGLTQVLPATGRDLAGKLGITDYDEEQLLHADTNLRLGARYMADQLDRFDDEIFVALAAYNAGPNGAQRWRDTAGNDADLFLETIEFAETRLYVELVSENYAIYRYLYGGEDTPNLPD